MRLRFLIVLTVVVGLVASVSAGPLPKKAETAAPLPGAATPKEAVARLDAAVSAAKKDPSRANDVVNVFAEPLAESLRTLFVLSAKVGAAQMRLEEALEKKFPKDASSKPRLPDFGSYEKNFREGLTEILRMELVGDGEPQADGRVLLTVKADVKSKAVAVPTTREDKYLAVKQADGTWRLLPAKLGDPKTLRQLQIQVEAFRKAPEAIDKVAGDVVEGKFKTRPEAHQAAFSGFLSVLQVLQQKPVETNP